MAKETSTTTRPGITRRVLKRMGVDPTLRHACGFTVGDRVVPLGCGAGEILGFGPALHEGKTVFVRLDNGRGNHGTYHTCGDRHVTRETVRA